MIEASPKLESNAPSKPELPLRRSDLIVSPHSNDGEYVIKDPVSGAYYHLGPEESLLLLNLDGQHTREQVQIEYERRFAQALSQSDLDDFVGLADSMHLLVRERTAELETRPQPALTTDVDGQSILYWRKRIFDPDRLFNVLEPRLRFVWTRSFLVLSAVAMLAALGVVWVNRFELVSRFADVLSWKTFFIAWFALVIATTLHEFAHGLTCKHFGGEVHEVGFLLLFFMPAFYCNVSDAWLFREKSKRLLVTLAGGYCDLLLWAAAVFVWRITSQETLVNYLAWVILTICGVRSFFNFNPLLKLDGYYLLSDIMSLPNLRQRSWDTLMEHVRWILWGAPRPAKQENGAFLLAFGASVWIYCVTFLVLMFVGLIWWLGERLGPIGMIAICIPMIWIMRMQFIGISNGEFAQMFKHRPARWAAWGLVVATAAAVLLLVPLQDKAGGSFQVRSAKRAEIRAPMAAFLRDVAGDEGDRIDAGAVIAKLEIPDLDSKIAQTRAEIAEAQAKLRLLRYGSRNVRQEAALETELRSAEIDAANATVARVQEELRYLQECGQKLIVRSSVAGVISTTRFKDKIGQYFNEGDLICIVEDSSELEAQIDVPEQEAANVQPGQKVQLKARSLPFDQLFATVNRVAPSATSPDPKEGKVHGTVPVYCKLTNPPPALRPGMTGFARIECGKRAMGRVLAGKALRYFRTEFWW